MCRIRHLVIKCACSQCVAMVKSCDRSKWRRAHVHDGVCASANAELKGASASALDREKRSQS